MGLVWESLRKLRNIFEEHVFCNFSKFISFFVYGKKSGNLLCILRNACWCMMYGACCVYLLSFVWFHCWQWQDVHSTATCNSSESKNSDPTSTHGYEKPALKRGIHNKSRSSFGKGFLKLRKTRSTSEPNLCKNAYRRGTISI